MSDVWAPAGLVRETSPNGTSFLSAGNGRSLLMIHGVGMNAEAMSPQLAHFSRQWRVLAIDVPGHGATPCLGGNPPLADYVSHVSAFLRDMSDQPAVVLGHSMGALIALGVALDAPELCAGVIALNAVYRRTPEAAAAVAARAAEIASASDSGDIDAPLRRWFGDDDRYDGLKAQVRRWLEQVPHAGYAAAYRVFASSDRAHEGRLHGLRVPALFMTGALDANSTPSMSVQMASAVPQGRAVILDEGRHNMSLTHPDLVNAEIDGWLKETFR